MFPGWLASRSSSPSARGLSRGGRSRRHVLGRDARRFARPAPVANPARRWRTLGRSKEIEGSGTSRCRALAVRALGESVGPGRIGIEWRKIAAPVRVSHLGPSGRPRTASRCPTAAPEIDEVWRADRLQRSLAKRANVVVLACRNHARGRKRLLGRPLSWNGIRAARFPRQLGTRQNLIDDDAVSGAAATAHGRAAAWVRGPVKKPLPPSSPYWDLQP